MSIKCWKNYIIVEQDDYRKIYQHFFYLPKKSNYPILPIEESFFHHSSDGIRVSEITKQYGITYKKLVSGKEMKNRSTGIFIPKEEQRRILEEEGYLQQQAVYVKESAAQVVSENLNVVSFIKRIRGFIALGWQVTIAIKYCNSKTKRFSFIISRQCTVSSKVELKSKELSSLFPELPFPDFCLSPALSTSCFSFTQTGSLIFNIDPIYQLNSHYFLSWKNSYLLAILTKHRIRYNTFAEQKKPGFKPDNELRDSPHELLCDDIISKSTENPYLFSSKSTKFGLNTGKHFLVIGKKKWMLEYVPHVLNKYHGKVLWVGSLLNNEREFHSLDLTKTRFNLPQVFLDVRERNNYRFLASIFGSTANLVYFLQSLDATFATILDDKKRLDTPVTLSEFIKSAIADPSIVSVTDEEFMVLYSALNYISDLRVLDQPQISTSTEFSNYQRVHLSVDNHISSVVFLFLLIMHSIRTKMEYDLIIINDSQVMSRLLELQNSAKNTFQNLEHLFSKIRIIYLFSDLTNITNLRESNYLRSSFQKFPMLMLNYKSSNESSKHIYRRNFDYVVQINNSNQTFNENKIDLINFSIFYNERFTSGAQSEFISVPAPVDAFEGHYQCEIIQVNSDKMKIVSHADIEGKISKSMKFIKVLQESILSLGQLSELSYFILPGYEEAILELKRLGYIRETKVGLTDITDFYLLPAGHAYYAELKTNVFDFFERLNISFESLTESINRLTNVELSTGSSTSAYTKDIQNYFLKVYFLIYRFLKRKLEPPYYLLALSLSWDFSYRFKEPIYMSSTISRPQFQGYITDATAQLLDADQNDADQNDADNPLEFDTSKEGQSVFATETLSQNNLNKTSQSNSSNTNEFPSIAPPQLSQMPIPKTKLTYNSDGNHLLAKSEIENTQNDKNLRSSSSQKAIQQVDDSLNYNFDEKSWLKPKLDVKESAYVENNQITNRSLVKKDAFKEKTAPSNICDDKISSCLENSRSLTNSENSITKLPNLEDNTSQRDVLVDSKLIPLSSYIKKVNSKDQSQWDFYRFLPYVEAQPAVKLVLSEKTITIMNALPVFRYFYGITRQKIFRNTPYLALNDLPAFISAYNLNQVYRLTSEEEIELNLVARLKDHYKTLMKRLDSYGRYIVIINGQSLPEKYLPSKIFTFFSATEKAQIRKEIELNVEISDKVIALFEPIVKQWKCLSQSGYRTKKTKEPINTKKALHLWKEKLHENLEFGLAYLNNFLMSFQNTFGGMYAEANTKKINVVDQNFIQFIGKSHTAYKFTEFHISRLYHILQLGNNKNAEMLTVLKEILEHVVIYKW